jgi:TP53 regulating kinase and related kinases
MLISKGAEAEIHLEDGNILKDRVAKSYRLKKLDDTLRKSRTKREAKILEKMPKEVPCPKLIETKETSLVMEHIDGTKVMDMLEKNLKICKEIGKKIAIMHNAGIIHGDLTTSNMIYKKKVYLIDFGLSYFSDKTEDKAVDLHLLRQALESRHYRIWKEAFDKVISGYKEESDNQKEILERLENVEARGRNKGKY